MVSGTHNYAGKFCDLAGRKVNSTQIAALTLASWEVRDLKTLLDLREFEPQPWDPEGGSFVGVKGLNIGFFPPCFA